MNPTSDSSRLVEIGDLDELLRHIDRLVEDRDWAGLLDLRDRCRAALERGKQLWPAASHAEYRLALEGPAEWAGRVLVEGTGYFALGPLTEVAASTHTWQELSPYVPAGPRRTISAHERVIRGEDLSEDDSLDPHVLDLPSRLHHWEPSYPLATYRPYEADFPSPAVPVPRPVELPQPGPVLDEPDLVHALVDLARIWTTQSNGRAEALVVEGDALRAIASLGPPVARAARIDPAEALAVMAWTAASSGAHGRRAGMATGRFAALWTLATIAGLAHEWPVPGDELRRAAAELDWWVWDADEPATGWQCQLAVADPADGLACALVATDAAE